MEFLKVWASIAEENTDRSADALGLKWAWEHRMISVLLFVIYIVLVLIWKGADQADSEIEDTILAIASPLLVFPVWWIARLPWTVASRETRSVDRIAKLRERLTPRFEFGSVRQVFTNSRNEDSEYLCLTVRNISEQQSDLCGAHIVELRSDTGSSIIDPVELNWMGSGGDQMWGHIPSGATRTVKVFRVWGEGLLGFNMQVVPAPYRGILEGTNALIGKIMFDDRYWGGQLIEFIVHVGQNARLEIIQAEAFVAPHQRDPEMVE